jgi:hypothetical protein
MDEKEIRKGTKTKQRAIKKGIKFDIKINQD